ncbi:hypothetical protein UCRNP2_8567 [Neofusicoccum parvum UCRNP2]|uniref:Uncharacterized protein n=1 Tax=Botryosphaeria parva (strain UCR-NP2) TaxID=1287680 RepID=R1EAA2_BOTPV|nr:hypothetical protein UCRNP2_8567 [Neofusicoccum parvum UCRNP2]
MNIHSDLRGCFHNPPMTHETARRVQEVSYAITEILYSWIEHMEPLQNAIDSIDVVRDTPNLMEIHKDAHGDEIKKFKTMLMPIPTELGAQCNSRIIQLMNKLYNDEVRVPVELSLEDQHLGTAEMTVRSYLSQLTMLFAEVGNAAEKLRFTTVMTWNHWNRMREHIAEQAALANTPARSLGALRTRAKGAVSRIFHEGLSRSLTKRGAANIPRNHEGRLQISVPQMEHDGRHYYHNDYESEAPQTTYSDDSAGATSNTRRHSQPVEDDRPYYHAGAQGFLGLTYGDVDILDPSEEPPATPPTQSSNETIDGEAYYGMLKHFYEMNPEKPNRDEDPELFALWYRAMALRSLEGGPPADPPEFGEHRRLETLDRVYQNTPRSREQYERDMTEFEDMRRRLQGGPPKPRPPQPRTEEREAPSPAMLRQQREHQQLVDREKNALRRSMSVGGRSAAGSTLSRSASAAGGPARRGSSRLAGIEMGASAMERSDHLSAQSTSISEGSWYDEDYEEPGPDRQLL